MVISVALQRTDNYRSKKLASLFKIIGALASSHRHHQQVYPIKEHSCCIIIPYSYWVSFKLLFLQKIQKLLVIIENILPKN